MMLVRVFMLVVVALLLTGKAAAQPAPTETNAVSAYKRLLANTIVYRMRIGEQPRVGGVATVRFMVVRSGLVTASSLADSSGDEDLDRLALAAVAAGTKFPPFPPQMTQESMAITTPLRFSPR